MEQLTNKLKFLRSPSKKSARQLLKDINKPNYDVAISNDEYVTIRIDKINVPLSLNDKIKPEEKPPFMKKIRCPTLVNEAKTSSKEVEKDVYRIVHYRELELKNHRK